MVAGPEFFAQKSEALEAKGAEGEPLIRGHLLDQDLLCLGLGFELDGKAVQHGLKFCRILAGHDDCVGGETVAEVVEGESRLLRRTWVRYFFARLIYWLRVGVLWISGFSC